MKLEFKSIDIFNNWLISLYINMYYVSPFFYTNNSILNRIIYTLEGKYINHWLSLVKLSCTNKLFYTYVLSR